MSTSSVCSRCRKGIAKNWRLSFCCLAPVVQGEPAAADETPSFVEFPEPPKPSAPIKESTHPRGFSADCDECGNPARTPANPGVTLCPDCFAGAASAPNRRPVFGEPATLGLRLMRPAGRQARVSRGAR